MRTWVFFSWLAFLCSTPILASSPPKPSPSEFPAHDLIELAASDGAPISLIHLSPQKKSTSRKKPPILFLMPGDMLTGYSLIGPIQAASAKGYEIYVAQARYVSRSAKRFRNGLHELLLVDYPELLEEVIARNPGRDIHIAGHSLGGVAALAMVSNERLARLFKGKIKTCTVFFSTDRWQNAPGWLNYTLAPALKMAKILFPWKHLLDFSDFGKVLASGMRAIPGLAGILRAPFSLSVKGADRISDAALLTFLRWGIAPIPIDGTMDLGKAIGESANTRMSFLGDLAKPIAPILSLAAEKDKIVPPADVRHLHDQNPENAFVVLEGLDHISGVLSDRDLSAYEAMLLFQSSKSPRAFAKAASKSAESGRMFQIGDDPFSYLITAPDWCERSLQDQDFDPLDPKDSL